MFRNALSSAMLSQLGDSLIEAYKTSGTKAIIIKAEGKVFSAGHDLRELVVVSIRAEGLSLRLSVSQWM